MGSLSYRFNVTGEEKRVGAATTEIGRIMQRDHSTIVHALSMNERDAGKALAIYEMKGRQHDAIQT